MVIGSLPTMCARRYPDKVATICHGRVQTFAQFNARVNSLVDSMKNRGLEKGHKVSVLSLNSSEVLEIMFACAKAGLVYVPLNFRLAAPEMKFVVNDAEIQLLFVSDDFNKIISQVKEDISCKAIVALGEDYENMISSGNHAEPPEVSVPSDLFAIFYTSGTTGGPKGVMLTHENFMSAAINHVIAYQLSPSDVCYHAMPFYHTMEASMAVCHFYVGGSNFIVDRFSADDFWTSVREWGITNITLVYTMLSDLLDTFEQSNYTLGSLKTLSGGGQSVPVDIIRRTCRVLGPNLLFQVYGLTEASPLLTYLPKSDMVLDGEQSRRLASIGKEMFSCHVRVVDDRDRDISPGEFGEIIARGPNVMIGYWKRPEETEAALKDGWLRTGDLATIDTEGYIYIVDRKKDIIISGGENISPREVEEVLYQHDQVRECSVIGVPDKRWGEQVKAVVVPRAGESPSEEDLIKFCVERLAKYKVPKSVDFVNELPKDPVGKIQKRILRDKYSAEAQ